jgi:primosomal protein N' (replication factor Y)
LRERVDREARRVRVAPLKAAAKASARRLRTGATDAEHRLWLLLRDRRLLGYRFRRQHPIGPFVVDFACTKHRLIIEVDGSQHLDSDGDARRTVFLERAGWRVVRFWNNDVTNTPNAVLEAILAALAR